MHDTQNNNSTPSVPDATGDAGAVPVARFTPGPWEVKAVFISQANSEALHFGEYRLNLWGIAGRTTPEGTSPTLSRTEAEANAQLIAAAPEMYAALVTVREACKNQDDFIAAVCATREAVQLALAKAEGRA